MKKLLLLAIAGILVTSMLGNYGLAFGEVASVDYEYDLSGAVEELFSIELIPGAYAGTGFTGEPVGGLLNPVPESELYGELAKQYSLWLIPAISAIGIGVYLFKRKF